MSEKKYIDVEKLKEKREEIWQLIFDCQHEGTIVGDCINSIFAIIDSLAVEREPVETDAVESELETRKIACPRMAICDNCKDSDICPNKIAWEQLEALKRRAR